MGRIVQWDDYIQHVGKYILMQRDYYMSLDTNDLWTSVPQENDNYRVVIVPDGTLFVVDTQCSCGGGEVMVH